MIPAETFVVDPWRVIERTLDLDRLAQAESVFALSNGHIGWRGNLDEGEPFGVPGSYLNSFHELRDVPAAELAYGQPESGEVIVNVTNGKLIRLLVDDEPFDVRYGRLLEHERVLDLRAGTLSRRLVWESPAGDQVAVRSTRLVSFEQRSVAAVRYEVEAVNNPVRVVLQSELVTNEELPQPPKDPRVAPAVPFHLEAAEHWAGDDTAVLVHRTTRSGLTVAVAMANSVSCTSPLTQSTDASDDIARTTVTARLEPGATLRLDKLVAYGWSSTRTRPGLHDQVVAALAAAQATGWDALVEGQRAFLDEFWDGADVEVEGDDDLQQAVRFGLFHVLQAAARAESRPVGAKGLTGPGYEGHAFWDSDAFVVPVLNHTWPAAARDILGWRTSTLPAAYNHARVMGLEGAAFPWRTITGAECSGYWPASTAAFHVNADVADAALRYIDATGDVDFERGNALDLLVGAARLFQSLGTVDDEGAFHIDGVTGPDEYSAVADDNVFTNLMAAHTLESAAELAERHPSIAETRLDVTEEERQTWRFSARRMAIPFNEHLGVHEQARGFTRHARFAFERVAPEQYPLLLNYPYFQLYRTQVVKQADLVLAMYLRPEAFTEEQKAANFAYYEQITVRDSSLSAGTQAVIAAEVGHLGLAYAYAKEAALLDLDDLAHNTRDGIHLASLANTWTALVAGFGGMRLQRGGTLTFAPRLPGELRRLAFTLRQRGRRLRVSIAEGTARYELLDGQPITIAHHGEMFELGDEPVERGVPSVSGGKAPTQPIHREPPLVPLHRKGPVHVV